jgi:IS30 family transposase
MQYEHLTILEREYLAIYLYQELSYREIGRRLDRHHTTIGREIKRNKYFTDYRYSAFWSDLRAQRRKSDSVKRRRLRSYKTRAFVTAKLKLGWSPEIIAGRLKELKNIPSVSYEAIYQYVYLEASSLIGYLARRHKSRYPKNQYRKPKRSLIPNKIAISERPENIDHRDSIGHWESDSVLSAGGTTALNVLLERSTRLTRITKISQKTAQQTHDAIVKQLGRYPAIARQSITYDNGSENTMHELTNKLLSTKSYFCEPYHSWEKGSVEQINGLIRRFLPKKMNFDQVSDKEIKRIENLLNNRPRKCLGYKTPLEVFRQQCGALAA